MPQKVAPKSLGIAENTFVGHESARVFAFNLNERGKGRNRRVRTVSVNCQARCTTLRKD